ncbi:MAG: tyrosine-type recombinase/integrase [Acidimicrobiales bacterium]
MPTNANEALLDSWQLSLHGKAPRTVRLYLDEARRFAAWLAEHGRPAANPGDLLAVDRRDAEAWLTSLKAAGRSQATMRNRWVALRNLYGWAVAEEEIAVSPLERVVVAKANPPAPDVLSDDELGLLLKACSGADFYARRDLALVRLMLATGMRVSEVCDLTIGDLDLVRRIVSVRHGKGDKARLVRYDAATAAALDRYKRVRARHRLAASPWLWIGHRGRVTRKGVPRMLDKRAAIAGIDHVHPHQLRHTWADRWLRAGGNEGDLQRLGGWESAEIMRRYGEARAVDRALAAYDTINPMGQL